MSVYDASIPVVKDALASLAAVLKKAEAAPNAADLPAAKIYEDMLPLSFQVHMVTDTAAKVVARLSGTEPVALDRDLKSLAEFQARIAHVSEIVDKADKELIDGRAGETVTIGMGAGKTATLGAGSYLSGYALPNIYFHLTTSYNIVRKEGVPVGKMDFLGPFINKHLAA